VTPPARAGAVGSAWDLVTGTGDPGGPVAVGGDLDVPTLLGAYRRGIFPWPAGNAEEAAELERRFGAAVRAGAIPSLSPGRAPGLELPWWDPDPRAVIPVDAVHVSRSLRARLRRCGWTTTLDRRFAAVVRHCAQGRASAWITPELAAAYQDLHRIGVARSIEVWDGGELIGGMYGVLAGAVFSGESMFHRRDDASKVALADMALRLRHGGASVLDIQFTTAHLLSMGAVEIPRSRFRALLAGARGTAPDLDGARRPVSRLLG
jgi:leucyl/phenylalanyl-tRNA---protein transferase